MARLPAAVVLAALVALSPGAGAAAADPASAAAPASGAAPSTVAAASPAAPATATTAPGTAGTPWSLEAFASGLGGLLHRRWTGGADAGLAFQVSSFRAVLLAPLRFDSGGLRRADWDERTDFGRIVGEIAWGDLGDAFQARLAPLEHLTLGTGTLVSSLASTVDPDHWRTGLLLSLDLAPAGGVLFLDSLLDPEVFGGRAFVRPFFWADDRGTFGRLEVGFTLAGDAELPTDPRPGPPGRDGLPASHRGGLMGGGIDLRWPVWRNRVVELTPQAAWSRLGNADGAHAGLVLALAPHRDVRLRLQGEWRWMGAGMVVPWFDGLYMADRHDFGGMPKIRARDGVDRSRMGGNAALAVEWRPWLSLQAGLDYDPLSAFTAFRTDLAFAWGDRLRATGTLVARGLRARSLDRPDRLLGSASLDVQAWKSIAVFAAYARDLAGTTAADGGFRYRPSDTVLAGVRLALTVSGGSRAPAP